MRNNQSGNHYNRQFFPPPSFHQSQNPQNQEKKHTIRDSIGSLMKMMKYFNL